MRTNKSFTIEDSVIIEMKKIAKKDGKTLSSKVNEILESYIEKRKKNE